MGFNGQNWLIVPATPLLPPNESSNQEWLLTLTGVFAVNLEGKEIIDGSDGWQVANFAILPDIQSPLKFGLDLYGVPHPTFNSKAVPFLNLVSTQAPYATISGAFDLVPAIAGLGSGSGFIMGPWGTITDQVTDYQGNMVNQLFQGIGVDISAQNVLTINRIGYNFTLRGQVVYLDES